VQRLENDMVTLAQITHRIDETIAKEVGRADVHASTEKSNDMEMARGMKRD